MSLTNDRDNRSPVELQPQRPQQPPTLTYPPPSPPKAECPPFHILNKNQKWCLVLLTSLAGCLSPLSANIYFPAMDAVADDLHISTTHVALTVTIYMVFQGIAPSLFAPIADIYGRRSAFLVSLTIYVTASIALAKTSTYSSLMALRGLQAAGSSATISISAGVIADIACPDQRGGFMGVNAGVRMSAQAFGPVIGGVLTHVWGYRSVFWLLFVLGLLVFFIFLVFLPETQRSIAGNGSIPLSGLHMPLVYLLRRPASWRKGDDGQAVEAPVTSMSTTVSSPQPPERKFQERSKKTWGSELKNAFAPVAYILEKDVLVLLLWGAVAFTSWSMVTSSTTFTLLNSFPHLTSWQIGLCFAPNGLGCVAGSICTGWLMDLSFKAAENRFLSAKAAVERGLVLNEEAEGGSSSPSSDPARNDPDIKSRADFPIVRTRLMLMPYASMMLIICIALYGPSYKFNDIDLFRNQTENLSAPLILQFLIAFCATSIYNMNSTLLIDYFPQRPSSAAALGNLTRCLLGAGGVTAIEPLIGKLKATKAFSIVAVTLLLCSGLVWVEWRWGDEWKRRREEKLATAAASGGGEGDRGNSDDSDNNERGDCGKMSKNGNGGCRVLAAPIRPSEDTLVGR